MNAKATLLLITALNCRCYAQVEDTTASHSPRQLQTVTVRARSPLIRQEADRIVYDLQADPQSKTGSLQDIMRKIPYLSVDVNDNILLNGSTSYKVFINGRPSGLLVSNAKEVLRNIPASTIKSIEVITSPPARYDAEGLAGIINIITIKQIYDGYKGSANLHEKTPTGGPGIGAAFTSKKSKVDISTLAGVNRHDNPSSDKYIERIGTSDSSILHQKAAGKSNSHSAYASMELSYEIDSFDLVTGQVSWNTSKATGLTTETSALQEISHTYSYQLNNDNTNEDGGTDVSINYQRSFKANKDQLLTFSYQYLIFDNLLHNNIALFNRTNYSAPDYRQYNYDAYADHTARIDYAQPFKNLTIEGGLKTTFRKNESDFEYDNFNTATGKYEADRARSNIFSTNRNILAIYNSYGYEAAGWQLKAGIRGEQTIVNTGTDIGQASFNQRYLNILPSVLICRKFAHKSSLNFSYTNRIQRPSTVELNPFTDRSDPNRQTAGNPYLKPILSNVFTLSYLNAGKGTLNLSVCGMFFNNVFSPFPHYDPVTNITSTQYENYGNGRVLKTNIHVNYPITAKWEITSDADIRHITVNGAAGNTIVKNSGMNVYIFISSAYNIGKDWRANADFTYKMGGLQVPLGMDNGFAAASFSISKSIAMSKLTMSVAVENPFTTYRYAEETINGADFLQTTRSQIYYRRFIAYLNYRFGKLKEDVRKSKRGITSDNGPDN